MKVLLVSESYWPNYDGGALFERRLVKDLNKRGIKTSVWAPGERLTSYVEEDGNYQIYREKSVTFFANKGYRVSYWPFWHARQVIRATSPDVIHIHMASFTGWAALIWAKRYKIPIVATNHFMPENAYLNLSFLRRIEKTFSKLCWRYLVWFHNKADFVTTPTPTALEFLHEHGLRVQARAVTNGVDTDLFHTKVDTRKVIAEYKLPEDRPVLLYLGRVDGEKRLDVLVESMREVKKELSIHLVVAGRGKALDGLKALAESLSLEGDITFTGFVPEEDKPALYNAADCFIITSPAELQSIVTLEAMACGLPVIATDVAALRELCRSGENGYLIPDLDSGKTAEIIVSLLGNPDLMVKFGERSRNIVLNEHAHQVMVESYVDIYTDISGKQ